ncbi:MAG: hypothetical protein CM15mP107_3480 [Bacteroidota bacterium]|nr:MAG: hypothetical protein CM15mP107_3480 [Bacteroidota bacterium]
MLLLISLNNDNIESWNWTIDEQEHSQTISDLILYIFAFEDKGYSIFTFFRVTMGVQIHKKKRCNLLNGYEARYLQFRSNMF